MMAEMLAWSRSRGVFAGVSLQGSTLREDGSENRDNYGKALTNREIVKGRQRTASNSISKTSGPFGAPGISILS